MKQLSFLLSTNAVSITSASAINFPEAKPFSEKQFIGYSHANGGLEHVKYLGVVTGYMR